MATMSKAASEAVLPAPQSAFHSAIESDRFLTYKFRSPETGEVMKPEIEIYDTTLRDGSQGEGINFSVMDKLRIAEKLDAFGVHYIEGGWPGSNPKDIEFFEQAKAKKFKNARLAAFGSTRRKGVKAEDDEQVQLLIDAATPV